MESHRLNFLPVTVTKGTLKIFKRKQSSTILLTKNKSQMKKTLIAIAALAAAMVGCTQYGDDSITINEESLGNEVFYGYIDDASRTLIDSENKLNWEANDFVSVFNKTDHNLKYTVEVLDGTDYGRNAKFTYAKEYVTGTGATLPKNYTIFPYHEANTISGEVLQFPMASTVTGVTVGNADNIPLVAYDVDGNHTFYYKNPTALLRVNVLKEDNPNTFVLKTLTISSRKGQLVSGTAQVDMSGDTYVATIVDDADASSSVTLDLGEGVTLTTERQYLYVAIPAMTFETDDLSISFTATVSGETKSGTIHKAASIKFEAGKMKQTSVEVTSDSFSGSTEDVTSVANVAGVEYKTIEEAFDAAIALGGDQSISVTAPAIVKETIEVPTGSNIQLILNGFTVTSEITDWTIKTAGGLNIVGGSFITENNGIRITDEATVTIGEGASLISNNGLPIFIPADVAGTINVYGTCETKMVGGGYAAIQTNALGDKTRVINIYEGAKVISAEDVAIYVPNATLNVYGGEITGATAIYHKKGTLNIAGGVMTATGSKAAYAFNGNGCTVTGDALVVEACEDASNYTPCAVTIVGGTFIANDHANGAQAIAYYEQPGVTVVPVDPFVLTAGLYNTDPGELVSETFKSQLNTLTGMYEIVPDYIATVDGVSYVSLQEAVDAAIASGKPLTLTGDPDEDESILIGGDITIIGSSAQGASFQQSVFKSVAKAATMPVAFTTSASRAFCITESNIKVTLENIAIISTAVREGNNDIRGITVYPNTEGVELTLNNVSIAFTDESADDWSYGLNVSKGKNHKITVNAGTIAGSNAVNVWGEGHNIDLNGLTLNCIYGENPQYVGLGIKLDCTGSRITLDDYTFNNNGTNLGNRLWCEETFGTNVMIIDGVYQATNDAILAEALAQDGDIAINMLADLSLNVSDAYIKLGGASTNSITIDGNEHTWTWATTYWSRINTTNPEAVIILNDMDLTSSQTSGTWNSYDVTFMCKAELNNVNLLKATALENAATLNNVTIVEPNGYYGLWITAAGQTVNIDGLSITATNGGRGIAIKDEYVDAPEKVTLNISNATFETASKAAILVTSTGGADIIASNLDITKVAADDYHAVWVDEDRADYYDLVTVDGCYKILEGDTRIADGLILKANGEYWLYSAEGLKYIRDEVNATVPYSNDSEFEGKTVKQMNDIDLGGEEWIPIGDDRSQRTEWHGIFDGQNFAIKNFKITQKTALDDEYKSSYGLFGNVKGTVKNLTVSNAQVSTPSGVKFVAALVGRLNGGLVENCKVVDSSVKAQGWTVGALIAQYNNGEVKGCSVENTTVEAPTVGGIIGLALNAGDRVIENCSVKNSKFINTKVYGGAYDAMIAPIVGGLYNGALNVTLNGCSTLNNTENGVAVGNTFEDFVGYISDGDKLTVDGKEYVAEGVWSWDNAIQLTNLTGLKWLANEVNVNSNTFSKKTVKLVNDIDLKNEAWTPIGTSSTAFQGTFDGNNKTISNLYIAGGSYSGLFGNAWGAKTIKNFTIINANVNGGTYVAAVAGNVKADSIENITVTGNVNITGTGQDIAVIAGYAYSDMKDITIDVNDGSYVKALKYDIAGAIAGYKGEGKYVNDNLHSNIDVITLLGRSGGLIGMCNAYNTITNSTCSGDVIIENATAYYRSYQIGGIIGAYVGNNVTVTDCQFNGGYSITRNGAAVSTENLPNEGLVGMSYDSGKGVLNIDGVTYDTYLVKSSDTMDSAMNNWNADNKYIVYSSNVEIADKAYTVPSGKNVVMNMNGFTLTSSSSNTTGNYELFLVKGDMKVIDGTINHTCANDLAWSWMGTIYDITAGGVLTLDSVVNNISGTSMSFVAHLNNWGKATLVADNSEFNSNYCGVRVFNSGFDMNNVSISNSKLKGKSMALWVHNYIGDLNKTNHPDDAVKARLNLDIFGKGNEFIVNQLPSNYLSPIRLGFSSSTCVFLDVETGKELGIGGAGFGAEADGEEIDW